MKTMTKNEMGFYFKGGYNYVSNKYFTFKHIIDDNNIIVCTNNVKFLKGNPVLIVDNDKGVYLKDWQIKRVVVYGADMAYLVKLDRNYFKPYKFSFKFDDMYFEEEDTFDSLFKCAKEQDEDKIKYTVEL